MSGHGTKREAATAASPAPGADSPRQTRRSSVREPLQKRERVLGYVRVSTADQAANGISMDEQEHRVRSYAAAHGLHVVRVERENGVSGKATANRPALLRALKRGEAGGLVVGKLDRLSRSLRDAMDLVARSEREGWELHSIGENLDTSTPHGRFVVHLFAALAQLEREQIGERTRNGMAELRRQGRRISRRPPFGFRFEGGNLEPVEAEQSILRRMEAMSRDGMGPSAIAGALASQGVLSPRTGRPWTPGNVGAILRTAGRR